MNVRSGDMIVMRGLNKYTKLTCVVLAVELVDNRVLTLDCEERDTVIRHSNASLRTFNLKTWDPRNWTGVRL